MRRLAARHWKSDRGATMVEFALVVFMAVMVLLGVVEMGRMVLVYTTMANAARAGARYAIVHGGDLSSGASGPAADPAEIIAVVKNFASMGLLNTNNLVVHVTYPSGSNLAGSPVVVTTSYVYDPLVSYFDPALSVTLGSESEGVITF
jgi:Flp pilus assembly protein TadG